MLRQANPIKIYSDAAARNCDWYFMNPLMMSFMTCSRLRTLVRSIQYTEGYAFDEGFADYVAVLV